MEERKIGIALLKIEMCVHECNRNIQNDRKMKNADSGDCSRAHSELSV